MTPLIRRAAEIRAERIIVDGATLVDSCGRTVRRSWPEIVQRLKSEGFPEVGPMRLAKAVKEYRVLKENNRMIGSRS